MAAESVHNPDRFMADFRQILSQGRKRIGLLVGAGAPVSIRIDQATRLLKPDGEALIPDVNGLTRSVMEALVGAEKKAGDVLRQELGPNANIEAILSRVRLLENALGKTQINGLDGAGYAKLGKTICGHIGNYVKAQLPVERCAYNELVSWIGGTTRYCPIEVFTTNYDLLFEEAFEQARLPYFDGFSGGHRPFFDPVSVSSNELPARWVRLWKLHGSLGWRVEKDRIVRDGSRDANELIYPDHLKYELIQKQPYSALFDRLKQFLLTPDSLLIVSGFSFGDAHISSLIEEALAQNANAAVFAFQFKCIDEEVLAKRLASDHPNLSVYAADGAVIRGITGKWRPGELPTQSWAEIRQTFWRSRNEGQGAVLTLGDFQELARFCALAQASDLHQRSNGNGSFSEQSDGTVNELVTSEDMAE